MMLAMQLYCYYMRHHSPPIHDQAVLFAAIARRLNHCVAQEVAERAAADGEGSAASASADAGARTNGNASGNASSNASGNASGAEGDDGDDDGVSDDNDGDAGGDDDDDDDDDDCDDDDDDGEEEDDDDDERRHKGKRTPAKTKIYTGDKRLYGKSLKLTTMHLPFSAKGVRDRVRTLADWYADEYFVYFDRAHRRRAGLPADGFGFFEPIAPKVWDAIIAEYVWMSTILR